MQILRHSQIAVTMNVYSEVSYEETRKAIKRLGQSLGTRAGSCTFKLYDSEKAAPPLGETAPDLGGAEGT